VRGYTDTVTTVIAGQVKHVRTTFDASRSQESINRRTTVEHSIAAPYLTVVICLTPAAHTDTPMNPTVWFCLLFHPRHKVHSFRSPMLPFISLLILSLPSLSLSGFILSPCPSLWVDRTRRKGNGVAPPTLFSSSVDTVLVLKSDVDGPRSTTSK